MIRMSEEPRRDLGSIAVVEIVYFSIGLGFIFGGIRLARHAIDRNSGTKR